MSLYRDIKRMPDTVHKISHEILATLSLISDIRRRAEEQT